MIKPKILSICLLGALLVPMAGCQTPPPHDSEAQARDNGVQTRAREASLARDREAQLARDREARQARREAQLAYERKAQQAYEREEQARGREAQTRDRKVKVRGDQQNDVAAVLSERDIAAIREYYKQGHQLGLTVGRITKLRRGEAYPFGYTWRSLPSDLEARLSPLPQGFIRVIVGTEIGILDLRTRVVADLVENPAG